MSGDRGAPIVVLGGVTAAGKTGAAVALAERFGGELIGADSVQVYRGFDIGSAKATAAELRGVPQHLVDVVDPDEPMDAVRFAGLADDAIADILARGRLPIVVGGSGLWIRALLFGLLDTPPPDPALRARLEADADRDGDQAMHGRLLALDPVSAERLLPSDRIRVLRALEVHELTGTPLSALQDAHRRGTPRYDALFVVLDRQRDDLYDALRARIGAMLAAGWVEEVRALLTRWGPDVRALGSVGYRQVKEHVLDGQSLEETERLAYKASRVYSRRQRTWFKGERGVTWTTTRADLLSAGGIARVEDFWMERRPLHSAP